jgi:pyruvate formate lyase activating enzyme
MENNVQGRIHSIETFGSVDGPGIRFVIFVQGCAMRCQFCHNADTWDGSKGQLRTPESLVKQALRYRPYWGGEGGITVSGGEPLLQMDFLIELFRLAKKEGIHTAIDTAGQPFQDHGPWFEKFKALMQLTDLVISDIKIMDPAAHKKLTGVGNANIHKMLHTVSDFGVPLWIRQVLVPGVTDSPEGLRAERAFIDTLDTVEKVEVLPYHTMGAYKWEALGLHYPLAGIDPPTPEQVQAAEAILVPGKDKNSKQTA